MKRRTAIALLVAPTLAIVALGAAWWLSGHAAPYAGLDAREIKALAPERIAGLRAGEGLGYALAAELNDVPGPLHAMQLDLGLSDAQKDRVMRVYQKMNAEARLHGHDLIEAERALDAAFASGAATPEEVDRLTAEAAAIEGRLRAAHLRAHLETGPILTPEQRAAYAAARGYGHGGDGEHGGH